LLNKLGFLHYIKSEWLDATVSYYSKSHDLKISKEKLDQLIGRETESSEVKRKTIDVLTRAWIRTPQGHKSIQTDAFELFKKVEPSEYIVLHYGMLLIAFPFFRDICSVIGRLYCLYGDIQTNQIHQRMIEKWGRRTSMIRATDRVLQSMLQWQIIQKKNDILRIRKPIKISHLDLCLWFLETLLHSEQTNTMEYDRLVSLPSVFPFQLDVPFYYVKKSKRFEYSMQGLKTGVLSLR